MSLRPLVRALSCALLLAPVFASAAEPDAAAAKVKWVVPWKEGVSLDYAYEHLKDETKEGVRSRSRTTDTTTVRIKAVTPQGFVQSWTSKDQRYDVLDGPDDEQEHRALLAELADLALEVNLNTDGNFVGVHNMDAIIPRLRRAMMPAMEAGLERGVAEIADAKARADALATAKERAGTMMDLMLTPAFVEGMVSRMAGSYNFYTGVEVEPDETYALDTELANPTGGAPLPAKLTFSLSISQDDPEDLFVSYEMTVDPDKAGAMALSLGEKIMKAKATDAEKAEFGGLDIRDEGLFVVHRPSGVVEMFEATRTVKADTMSQVERYRLRQLNGAHEHVWRDDEATEDTAPAETAEPATPAKP